MTDKHSLWDSLPDLPLETGGVWDQINKDARSRMVEPSSTGFDSWLAPGYESSGIWDEIDDETLLLRPEELDLWLRLERDARAISPGDESVWEEVEEETLLIRPQEADMWREADDETLLLQPATAYVWPEMRPGDLTQYKPQRKPGWVLKPLTDVRGQPYFILKSARGATYLRLTPQQRFLWDLLDGQHSVQDLSLIHI